MALYLWSSPQSYSFPVYFDNANSVQRPLYNKDRLCSGLECLSVKDMNTPYFALAVGLLLLWYMLSGIPR